MMKYLKFSKGFQVIHNRSLSSVLFGLRYVPMNQYGLYRARNLSPNLDHKFNLLSSSMYFSTSKRTQNEHNDRRPKVFGDQKLNLLTAKFKPNESKLKLLSTASGPLSKLLIHIKWPLMRNNRPFSLDDMNAFFSWLIMGNLLWVVLGTTTFGLVLMYSIHTFDNAYERLTEYFHPELSSDMEGNPQVEKNILGYITSKILTNGLGINIEFSNGNVLPQFKDGKLRFSKFKIKSSNIQHQSVLQENDLQFEISVSKMDLTLSFGKWCEGKGIINELEIYGANGSFKRPSAPDMIESKPLPSNRTRSAVLFSTYSDSMFFGTEPPGIDDEGVRDSNSPSFWMDPRYELSSVKIYDSYFEVMEDESSKPFRISLFNCVLPKLRGNMILVDFFNADNVTGAVNDSMFTIHKRQAFNRSSDDKSIRFKLDGVNLATISKTNPRSTFNWIVNGKAEIIADITIQNNGKKDYVNNSIFGLDYAKISTLFFDLLNEVASASSNEDVSQRGSEQYDETTLLKSALSAIYQTFSSTSSSLADQDMNHLSEYIMVNYRIKFTDLKASLPSTLPMASSSPLPFISLQNLRSLILYINDKDTTTEHPIVVKGTAIEKVSALENIQKLSETKLFDSIVSGIYEELWKSVKQDEKRIINEKYNLWSHSFASQLLLLGLGVIA